MSPVRLVLFLICVFAPAALRAQPGEAEDFFPMSVWYGGGKARAPMLYPGFAAAGVSAC